MKNEELLIYFRNLKNIMDSHITTGTPLNHDIEPELETICNELIKEKIQLTPQFINEMYKNIMYLEIIKSKAVNCDIFIKNANKQYIENKKHFTGLQQEFYKKLIMIHINRITSEYDKKAV